MLKAKEIIIFLPGDGEKEVFKDVEFQSNPEAGLLAIFKNDGKESFMFSQGSLDNCFSPSEILNFSLSKLVTLKSSLSPTLRTSEG